MKEALTNLIKVKTIVTLVLTGVFSFLAINGTIDAKEFVTIFTVIIAFYFGMQSVKKSEDKGKK